MLWQAGAHQSPEPPHEEGSAPQLVCEHDIGEAHMRCTSHQRWNSRLKTAMGLLLCSCGCMAFFVTTAAVQSSMPKTSQAPGMAGSSTHCIK